MAFSSCNLNGWEGIFQVATTDTNTLPTTPQFGIDAFRAVEHGS